MSMEVEPLALVAQRALNSTRGLALWIERHGVNSPAATVCDTPSAAEFGLGKRHIQETSDRDETSAGR